MHLPYLGEKTGMPLSGGFPVFSNLLLFIKTCVSVSVLFQPLHRYLTRLHLQAPAFGFAITGNRKVRTEMKKVDECATLRIAWELWRQDDNGSRFLVGRYEEKSEAEEKMAELSRALHKQIYWISAVKQ